MTTMATDTKRTMSDIPTLQWLTDWANNGVAIALAVSFVFGAASIFLSKRLSAAKDEQSANEKRASDERIAALTAETEKAKKERAQADLRIEEARERASKADELAGEANERAEALEVQAQELTRQNLTLRSSVAGLEKETSEARTRQARAELELAEVRRRQQPRALNCEAFVKTVKEELKVGLLPGIVVLYQENDPEAYAFAVSVHRALISAKFPVDNDPLPLGGSNDPSFNKMPSTVGQGGGAGITLRPAGRPRDVHTEAIKVLTHAFAACGFEVTVGRAASPDGWLAVIIGPRP